MRYGDHVNSSCVLFYTKSLYVCMIVSVNTSLILWKHQVVYHYLNHNKCMLCFCKITLINLISFHSNFRAVAVQICQGLLDLGWIEPLNVAGPDFRDDFMLYIPGPVSLNLLFCHRVT